MSKHFEFEVGAHDLTAAEKQAILRWADIIPEAHPLMQAGAVRNAERWAIPAGLKLLAMLLEAGLLEAGEDPVAALNDLLEAE